MFKGHVASHVRSNITAQGCGVMFEVTYGPPRYRSFLSEPRHLPGGLYIGRTPGVGDLLPWARRTMARHVRDGYPEWEAAMVAGSAGWTASWTDGTADILTTFAVRGDAGLRFDVWMAALNSADPPLEPLAFRAHLAASLASVRWLA